MSTKKKLRGVESQAFITTQRGTSKYFPATISHAYRNKAHQAGLQKPASQQVQRINLTNGEFSAAKEGDVVV